LTDAQRVSIQGIREKHRPDLVLRRDAVRQAQAALRTALRDPATPEPQLRTLHDRASAAQFEVILARRSVRQDVQAVLTPEQRAKAVEMRGVAQGKARERMRHSRMATGLAG
jgi:Spy/CpxP family protein refolding chaperone